MKGLTKGLQVYLTGSHCYAGDYDYSSKEKLKNIIDFDNLWVVLYNTNHEQVEELLNV